MRSAPRDRGQATVEAVALWLIMAAIAAALLLGAPAARAARGRRAARRIGAGRGPSRPPPASAERALAGRPGRGGTPTLLAAERLLALELGPDGARELPRDPPAARDTAPAWATTST